MAKRRKKAKISLFFRSLHALLFGAGILLFVGLWCFYDPRFFYLLMIWIFVGRHVVAVPLSLFRWLFIKQCYQCHAAIGKESHTWLIDGKDRRICAKCDTALVERQQPYLEERGRSA